MQNVIQENEKRYPRFANFGEYLFWSYANLQMLCISCFVCKNTAFLVK